jgi:beta-glucosidase
VPDEDWQIIKQPVDFIGLNIYNGRLVDENGDDIEKYQGFPRTAMKWPVTPEVLRFGPRWIYKRYGLPVMISENGQSCNDRIFLDGKVHDPDRIDFLHRYLIELRKACDDGVPVTGYLHWCLTDNFEWHNGYDERFGLIYIDYSTQRRILKDSAQWYSEVVSTNGMHI